MIPTIDPPRSRDEIAAALTRLHEESTAYWSAFSTAEFFAPLGTAWSPADNVRHLTRSIRPVAQALRTPKVVLWVTFGIARRPSRSFEEMRRTYDGVLAGGAKAGRFAPSERALPQDLEEWRREIMRQREDAAGALVANLGRWSERALDRARLPHPLMGKLTVREMLFFTLYHNLHHVEVVERRKAASTRDPALT